MTHMGEVEHCSRLWILRTSEIRNLWERGVGIKNQIKQKVIEQKSNTDMSDGDQRGHSSLFGVTSTASRSLARSP